MVKIHLERGRIINARPEIIHCLWENWDVFDAVLGGTWEVRKEGDGVFFFKRHGVVLRMELAGITRTRLITEFKYLVTAFKFGSQAQAVITLKYSATKDNKTSVQGIVDVEVRGLLGIAAGFYQKTAQRVADELIQDGEKACMLISQCPKDIEGCLTSEQMETLERYLPKSFKMTYSDLPLVTNESLRLGIRNVGTSEKFCRYLFEVELGSFSLSSESLVDSKQKKTILSAIEKISDFARFARGYGAKKKSGEVQDIYGELHDTFRVLGEHLFFYFVPNTIRPHLVGLSASVNVIVETTDPDIPWELTFFNNNFLCLRHALGRKPIIHGLPITKYDNRAELEEKARKTEVLIMANPTGNLPESEKEAEEIVDRLKRFKSNVKIDFYKGEEVTKQRVIDCLHSGTYGVIHFAGHGDFNEDPRLSSLLLSDGPLLADEVVRVLQGTPVIFVNACSSAKFAQEKQANNMFFTENIQGMASAFLSRGAQCYVGALWPVSDKPAANFSVEFYKGIIERKETVGTALLKSKIQAHNKKITAIDFSWASFVLYGDPRRKLFA